MSGKKKLVGISPNTEADFEFQLITLENDENVIFYGWILSKTRKRELHGNSIPEGIQGHDGCGSGQPSLAVGNPADSRGVKTR